MQWGLITKKKASIHYCHRQYLTATTTTTTKRNSRFCLVVVFLSVIWGGHFFVATTRSEFANGWRRILCCSVRPGRRILRSRSLTLLINGKGQERRQPIGRLVFLVVVVYRSCRLSLPPVCVLILLSRLARLRKNFTPSGRGARTLCDWRLALGRRLSR